MKPKHSAAALKALALDGALTGCEARAFAAFHAGTLDAANHTDYVEAFVLQLGAPAQHATILALLGVVQRDFRSGKIAYKPPDAAQLTSILAVARWVSAHLGGGGWSRDCMRRDPHAPHFTALGAARIPHARLRRAVRRIACPPTDPTTGIRHADTLRSGKLPPMR